MTLLRRLFGLGMKDFYVNYYFNRTHRNYLKIGKHVMLQGEMYTAPAIMELDSFTRIQPHVRVTASGKQKVIIKKYTAISAGCTIVPGEHIPTVGVPQYLSYLAINDVNNTTAQGIGDMRRIVYSFIQNESYPLFELDTNNPAIGRSEDVETNNTYDRQTGGFSAYTFIPQSLPSHSPLLRESRARMWARALSSPMPLSALKGRLSCLAVLSSPSLRLPRLRLTRTLRRCQWYGAISGSWYLTCSS